MIIAWLFSIVKMPFDLPQALSQKLPNPHGVDLEVIFKE